MNIGSTIVAPDGYAALTRDTAYYLIANPSSGPLVTLAWFTRDPNPSKADDRWRADWLRIPQAQFEKGIQAGRIRVRNDDHAYPPWLSELEGLDPEAIEDLRQSSKRTYRNYATSRFTHIAGLVERGNELLAVDDLDDELAKHAMSCNPKQRTARIRLWLCAYLCFGNNLFALSPAYRGNGSWDRKTLSDPNKKLGRPNHTKGVNSGYSAVLMAPQIEAAYLKYAKLGKPMCDIYADAMVYYFGCKTSPDSSSFYQPEGKPYPSPAQFTYHATKRLTREMVKRQKYGNPRYRNKLARSKGKFSEATGNVMETIEGDVNYLRERPTRLLSNDPGDPLATGRLICVTTGFTCGVGFSYGAERREAYRAAWFFAAAPKSLLARLFGVDITDSDFPCTGLPRKYIVDRGAGRGTTDLMDDEDMPPIRDMSPSWMGQSKASVESSHPRHPKIDGEPMYTQSDLNVFQLVKREILRAAADNRSKDCSAHLTPEMIAARVPANPNGMVHYLCERGRVDVVPIALDRLIRALLKPVDFMLNAQGLWFFHLRYTSKDFEACTSIPRPYGSQQVSIQGYVAPLSVRLAWVEWRGRLIEVSATLPIRDSEDQLYISLSDLESLGQVRNELVAAQREEKVSASIAARDRFTTTTDKQWDGGVVKHGKAPARGVHRDQSDTVPTQSVQRSA